MPNQPQQQAVGLQQIATGSIGRSQLNVDFPGQAVIRRLIMGVGMGQSYTGVDSGTGDVTIFVTGTFFTEEQIEEMITASLLGVIHNDGWISDSNWVRLSNTAFMKNGDVTTIFRKGMKLRFVDGSGSTKFGVVGSSGFTSGTTTTVNLISTTDYIISGAISNFPAYSPIENPSGFPHWFNWNANPQGFSSVPTSVIYKWTTWGKTLMFQYIEGGNGTSDQTFFTATAPIEPITAFNTPLGTTVNNNVLLTVPGRITLAAGSLTITFRSDMANGAWTAALGKRAVGFASYEF